MRFRVIVEHDPEAEAYSAVCPELPGCASCGRTEKEALENLQEAIELNLEPAPQLLTAGAKEAFKFPLEQ